jgi:hypothetical protein
MEGTKVCRTCGIEKSLTEFYKSGGKYFQSDCKPCANKRRTEYDRAQIA